MEIRNQQITTLDPLSENRKWEIDEEVIIDNCIIDRISFSGLNFNSRVTIRNSIINKADLTGAFVKGGLVISQCLFIEEFRFDSGGHNKKGNEVNISGNIFMCFADFLDSHFDGRVVIRNNIFQSGTCYLNMRNPNSGSCIYYDGIVSENNIGKVDLD